MKAGFRNFFCKVGVSLDCSSVSLAAWRRRRGPLLIHKALAEGEDRVAALSALVRQEGVAGARCMMSLPVARCRIQWVPFAGAHKRDLQAAVARPAFWQSRMGVSLESHCVWWHLVRDSDGGGISALLVAASRAEVEVYVDHIRAAGLRLGRLGVSCFDYLGGGISFDSPEVSLFLDIGDACVMASGDFGLRVNPIRFDVTEAGTLLSDDSRVRDGMVDNLAACVRRCIEDEHSTAQLRAGLRVVAARNLQGDWLKLLQERLPGLPIEWVDGWAMVGMDPPRRRDAREQWRLPRALAVLAYDRRLNRGVIRRTWLPRVDLAVQCVDRPHGRRYLVFGSPVGACLVLATLGYLHWLLDSERRALQPDARRYAHLEQLHEYTREEIQSFQERLSQRILFYSSIQRISFERKLMPRLLASIGQATPAGMWLNTIHFRHPAVLRITGKSLGDEQISRFVQRLRLADGVVEAFLESAAVKGGSIVSSQRPQSPRDFAVVCRLRSTGEDI